MWELSSRSAVTRCDYTNGGVVIARHSGIFGHAEAGVIVPALARSYANGLIERYDSAITIFPEDAKAPSYKVPKFPWAIIVRPDQYDQAVAFCAYLATCGVLRTAWLPEHSELALQWCLMRAESAESGIDAKSEAELPPEKPLCTSQAGCFLRSSPVVSHHRIQGGPQPQRL